MPLPTTTAYVANADADAYFALTFRSTAWTALTDADKTTALQEATRMLETLCYKGEKCSSTQPLQWPRKGDASGCCAEYTCSSLPQKLVEATCELALQVYDARTSIFSAISATGPVKRQKLDVLEVEYFETSTGSASRYGPSAPQVLQKYPWLGDMLGECFLSGSYTSTGLRLRVRS